MANTTNFGWETPDDTDLVKDGALAMRTLGNAIDTSLVDLKGGTTGQVLSKNTNTDMDFTWTTPNVGDITEVQAGTGISVASGTGPIPVVTNTVATAFDAKGDLIVGTGADTFSRLAVGTNDYVLTAASGETTGLKWTALATTKNYALINAGGTSLTGATTITVSSISGKDDLLVFVRGASSASGGATFTITINSDTGTNYYRGGGEIDADSTYSASIFSQAGTINSTSIQLGKMGSNAAAVVSGGVRIFGANTSGVKPYTVLGAGNGGGGNGQRHSYQMGIWTGSATISSISINSDNGNFDAGTIYVYGAA